MAHEVVISGIGANFPQSLNVQDFGRDLLANKYLPTPTDRWVYDSNLNVKPTCGQVPYKHFDDLFYGINKRLAKNTDPVSKMGYLRSFEAIMDAGLHPFAMRGEKVGVFAGCGINEFEQKAVLSTQTSVQDGYCVMGLSRTMFPNRVSYFFDFNGPSCAMDHSYSVAHLMLQQASDAIRTGQCEAALVVAANLVRFPESAYLLNMLGIANSQSMVGSFDDDASGLTCSDSCVAFFLQRSNQAKRCYARVLASGVQYTGPGSPTDMTMPNSRGMRAFLADLYEKHSIDPRRIAYLEADGGGHPIRDEMELNAIDAVLYKGAGRKDPLLVGSVKSNVGHTDCASGFVAICKAITAMETGTIPATINYRKPNARVEGLAAGRLRVVDTNTPLKMGANSVIAVNTLGLASTVGHTVLAANHRGPQPPQNPAEHLPRLITVSGRTEDSVGEVARKVKSAPFDTNYYRLVQDVFSPRIRGYDYRSFVICPSAANEVPPVQRLEKRTVWYVYSGMGSQWAGMGAGLMRVPVFAETIERLHAILVPKGMDLKHIITEKSSQAFDNILKSFVGITACQIALTNVLKAVGITPDGIIGHSVGELACAYVDGCLTEEQTILAAWARGIASNKAKLIQGMMAAVGLGYKAVLPRLPPSIDVACHNSDSSCTLSGPAEDVARFVEELSAEGVFARAVNVSDIAYHSRYIQPAAPFLREELEKVITHPKKRSSKWISTSVPLEQQDSELAKYCSADYQTNNLLSPVLFEEALEFVPKQCMVIEIAPHGLLQAILKRALPDPWHIALTQRGHEEPVHMLLAAIGRMSFGCVDPNVAALYPDVQFPVPPGTGSLATLSTFLTDDSAFNDVFDEIMEWTVPILDVHFDSPYMRLSGTRIIALSESLLLMWSGISQRKNEPMGASAVSFRDVHVTKWQTISNVESSLLADIMLGTSQIEICDDNRGVVVRACAYLQSNDDEQPPELPPFNLAAKDTVTLSKEELYRDLETRGVEFCSKYQTIKSIQIGEKDWVATVSFNGQWESLVEAVLQIFLLRAMDETQDTLVPRTLQRLEIRAEKIQKNTDVVLRLNLAAGVVAGSGVYASGFTAAQCPAGLRSVAAPSVMQFVPFGETKFKTAEEFLRVAVNSVLETTGGKAKQDLTLMELPNGRKTSDLSKALINAIRTATGIQSRLVTLTPAGTEPPGFQGTVPLLVTGPATITEAICSLAVGLASALLVWSSERMGGGKGAAAGSSMAVLAEQRIGDDWITLLRRATPVTDANAVVVQMGPQSSSPSVVLSTTATVVLVWRGIDETAMQAAIAEADTRSYASRARLMFIDNDAPKFSLDDPLYADQLARGVRVSVLSGRTWGCWMTLPIPKPLTAALSASTLDDVKMEFVGMNPLDQGSLSGHVDYVGEAKGAGRVMGIGQWLADHRRPELDPLLRWPVPESWSAKDAATVPYVYSVAYFSLKAKAAARRGESILVHEGTSPLGQAAIRVASELGCSPIYTTVRDAKQRELLHSIFPQLEPCHVLACGDGGSFEYRLRTLTRGSGVRIVVNTLPDSEMRASLRCLGSWGRLLHYKREDMLAARTFGTQLFLNSIAVFGFSGSELFRSSARDRAEVAEAMSQGLRNSVVQPIVGVKVYDSLDGVTDYDNTGKAVIEVNSTAPSASQQCDPQKCYLVVGNQASDALLVAGRLSMLGARHILAAVGSSASSAVIRQRQRALRRQQGAHLHVQQVRAWDSAAAEDLVKAAASVAPLHTAVVITKDDVDVGVPSLLSGALSAQSPFADVRMVLLAERAQSASQLAGLATQRSAQGHHTACMAAPLTDALNHLADLLSGAAGASSAITVLPSTGTNQRGLDADDHHEVSLPQSPSALSELSAGLDRCANGPCLLELPSLAPPSRSPRENQPLFVLAPLGVLESASREQIAGLAARLFSPVFIVETTVKGTVEETAKAVVKAILRRQPLGPYNLMGWRLGTVLALASQRQLQSVGKCGKLFLVHGDVQGVKQWATTTAPQKHVAEVANKAPTDASARRGTLVVGGLLDAIARHEPDVRSPFTWHVHIIRTSVDHQQSFDESDAQIQIRTLTDTTLNNSMVARYVNESFAHSQLAGNEDLRASAMSHSS